MGRLEIHTIFHLVGCVKLNVAQLQVHVIGGECDILVNVPR